MHCVIVSLMIACLVLVPAPARAAPPPQEPVAAACAAAACVFLPIVRQPGLTALVVIDNSGWITGSSQYNFMNCYGVGGTIQSALLESLYDVVLEARYFDQTGHLVATDTGTTLLHSTSHDRPNAFVIDATDSVCTGYPRPDFRALTIELAVTSLRSTAPRDYRPLAIVDFQYCDLGTGESPYNPGTITVRNDNPVAVTSAYLVTQHGGYRYERVLVADILAPGKSASYTPYCDVLGRGDVTAAVGAEGVAVP